MRNRLALIAAVAGLAATTAFATQQRSFVASTGSDGNPCTIGAPCRSFAAAIAQTADGGEVIVQDHAGYGSVTIATSVSLISPSVVYAGISVFGGAGIVINGAGAKVVLRGLSINGQGGATGVEIDNAARVRIEGCEISNMTATGIAHAATGAGLVVIDTLVRDNGGTGIDVSAGATTITLDRVRSVRNAGDGLHVATAGTRTSVSIVESSFAQNGTNGIWADAYFSPGAVVMQIERSELAQNAGAGYRARTSLGGVSTTIARTAFHDNGTYGAEAVSAGSFGTTLIRDSQFANHGQAALRASGAGGVLTTTRNTFQEATVYREESLSAIVSDGSNVGTGGSTGTLTVLAAF